jgi:hypothetical protein
LDFDDPTNVAAVRAIAVVVVVVVVEILESALVHNDLDRSMEPDDNDDGRLLLHEMTCDSGRVEVCRI